jgi:hypothetical protein
MIDEDKVDELKKNLFAFTRCHYRNTIVAQKLDGNVTDQVNMDPLATEPLTELRLYFTIELIVCEVQEADGDASDTFLLSEVNKLVCELGLTRAFIAHLALDEHRELHSNILSLTKYDPAAFKQNFFGANLDVNCEIQQFATRALVQYQIAFAKDRVIGKKHDYMDINTNDPFFNVYEQAVRASKLEQFKQAVKKLHRSQMSLTPVIQDFNAEWQRQSVAIVNMWVESSLSLRGAAHKQKHLLIYGDSNKGKTTFFTETLFGYLHPTVSRDRCFSKLKKKLINDFEFLVHFQAAF